MEKHAILAAIPASNEERMTLSSVYDKWEQSRRRNMPCCSRFLTEAEQELTRMMLNRMGEHALFYGGYEGAERRVAAFLPDYLADMGADCESCGLTVLRFTADKFHAPPTHRDYLGALMGLGMERDCVGDLLVSGHEADCIFTEAAAKLVLESLAEVGRCRVGIEAIEPSAIRIPTLEVIRVSDTVASMRLDGIVAAAFGVSRDEANRAVKSGKVQIGGRIIEKNDAECHAGDKISLRGYGKATLASVDGLSKKGRIRVTFEKPK